MEPIETLLFLLNVKQETMELFSTFTPVHDVQVAQRWEYTSDSIPSGIIDMETMKYNLRLGLVYQ